MNIQTLVFLDMETTGLPYEEGNRTKITEMCLVAVQAEHVSLGAFPRVLNKLSFCFNPVKTISPSSRDLTGLTNTLLQNQSTFQKGTVEMINNFLALQSKPLCLVAHNGNNFDYPILLAEVYNARSSLPENILCVDSLQAFRELDRQNSMEELDIHDLPTQVAPPVEFCDGYDEMLFNITEGVETSECQQRINGFDEMLFKIAEEVETSKCHQQTNGFYEMLFKIAEEAEASECQPNKVQQTNETTPTKKAKLYITDYFMNAASTSNINDAYYMPNVKDCSGSNVEKNKKQSLNLNWGKSSTSSHVQSDSRRQSFKLTAVYSRLTTKECTQSYRAETDCSMLIECVAKIGQGFINWANRNARKLSDVRMMQPGRKFEQ